MTTLVVSDLDGTLWDNSMRCHPDTMRAVAAIEARDDVEFLVATGRRRVSALRGYEANDLVPPPSIFLNGAVGYDFATAETFHQVSLDQSALSQVIACLQEHELAPVAHLGDAQAFAIEGASSSLKHLESLGSDLAWASFDQLAERPDVLGISILGVPYELIEPAFADLGKLTGIEVAAFADQFYTPYSMMIAPQNVTKALGINAYLAHRDMQPDRIVALGDGGNDLAMLEMADVAIGVAGGDQTALDLADHIIDGPATGGWAAVLAFLY